MEVEEVSLSLLSRSVAISDFGYSWRKDCVKKVYFNKEALLNDPTMPIWNSFHLLNNKNNTVYKIINTLVAIVDMLTEVYDQENKKLITIFVNSCLQHKNTQTEDEQKVILKRIGDVTDILEGYISSWEINGPSNIQKQNIKSVISRIVKIILSAGGLYLGEAIFYLEKIEMTIKLVRAHDYFPNVLINLFKRSIIESLIGEDNNKNLKYLVYALRFNKILGLGLGLVNENLLELIDTEMSYIGCISIISIEEAIQFINARLTEEHLIAFTIASPRFNAYMKQFEKEVKHEINLNEQVLNKHYDDFTCQLGDIGTDQKEINENSFFSSYQADSNTFFKEKAIEFYVKAGFLIIK